MFVLKSSYFAFLSMILLVRAGFLWFPFELLGQLVSFWKPTKSLIGLHCIFRSRWEKKYWSMDMNEMSVDVVRSLISLWMFCTLFDKESCFLNIFWCLFFIVLLWVKLFLIWGVGLFVAGIERYSWFSYIDLVFCHALLKGFILVGFLFWKIL